MLALINAGLAQQGLLLKTGTVVDAIVRRGRDFADLPERSR
jgi:hypothetical protein